MFSVTVSNKQETQQLTHGRGAIELGRGPARDGVARLVVRDAFVSRDHVRFEELPGSKVRIVNLSTKAPVMVDNHSVMSPGTDCELPFPVRIGIGETVVDLESADPEPLGGDLLTVRAPARGGEKTQPNLLALGEGLSAEEVVGWLETIVGVQKASGSQEFLQETANALVERVGLDAGLVIQRENEGWRVVAGQSKIDRPQGRMFSQTILNKVLVEKRTFYMPSMMGGTGESLVGVQGVVASPVFDVADNVIGIVYGTRVQKAKVREIGKLEAQVVQLLAAAVGAGMARIAQDAETHRLRVEKDAAEEADRAKSGFLAMVSHELRTPLTTIIGYSEMLIEQATADKHTQYLDDLKQVHSAGQHLLALINDILDFSKIEAGKLEVAHDPYAPTSLIQDLMVGVGPLAKKNNNKIELDCPSDLGRGIGDPTRIRQCILNLVGNACKFTSQGTVKVVARRVPGSAGDTLVVQVTDTGIGMTPEQVARLGRPFEQVDSTSGRKYGGTGLGLAISMKLCAAMGGKIEVKSELQKGSTFTMTIKAELK